MLPFHRPMRNKPSITVPDAAREHATAALREYCAANMEEEMGDLSGAGCQTEFPSSTRRTR